ncbi:MAG: TraR/DksA family transcriptional regulator [Candidatus Binataceae bacterium]
MHTVKSNLSPSVRSSTRSDRTRAHTLEMLRQTLTSLREQETRKLGQFGCSGSEDTGAPEDEADSAKRQRDLEMFATVINFAEVRLATVEAALERLVAGRYGICEDCEDQIPSERLRAVPTTVYCVDCQNRREKASSGRARREPSFILRNEAIPEDVEEDESEAMASATGQRIRGRASRGASL